MNFWGHVKKYTGIHELDMLRVEERLKYIEKFPNNIDSIYTPEHGVDL